MQSQRTFDVETDRGRILSISVITVTQRGSLLAMKMEEAATQKEHV